MEKEKIELLNSIGVDVDDVMERFLNSDEFYFKCLQKFENDMNYKLMIEGIKRRDGRQIFEASHALKGVAGNLGFGKLFADLVPFVNGFRDGAYSYSDENYQSIQKDYNEILEVIDKLV